MIDTNNKMDFRMSMEAAKAFYDGDFATAVYIVQNLLHFDTVNVEGLGATTFKTPADRVSLREIAAADPNDRRPDYEKAFWP